MQEQSGEAVKASGGHGATTAGGHGNCNTEPMDTSPGDATASRDQQEPAARAAHSQGAAGEKRGSAKQEEDTAGDVGADENEGPADKPSTRGRDSQNEFAFKPTRPRSRTTARRAGAPGALSETILNQAPTSGLDSLAAAASLWEMNEGDEPQEGAAPVAGSQRAESESRDPAGEYLDYEEDEEYYEDEDYEEGDASPYAGGRDQSEGGGRRGSQGRRGARRGGAGAAKTRDPTTEVGAEEAGLIYAANTDRPDLDQCTPEAFEADLVGFLTARGERQLAAHVREKRITCNSLPLDIYGLYREVVKRGGYIANERYDDKGSRWTGTINFAGEIFPRLRNWTANNRATSVGSQLLNNYRKFLLAYERAYLRWDLPHTEMAAQQRAAASMAGGSYANQAAAIVAAAQSHNARRMHVRGWETEMLPSMMPPPRRSTHGGAGKRGSSHQVALEPVGGWQGGYGDTDRMTGDDEDYDRPGVTTRAAAAGGWLAGDITNVVDMGGDGRAHQGPSKRRRGAGREGRGDGGGSADGTPGSAIPHLPGMASGVIPPLPGMAGATHQPGVQHVQELQRLWGSAQMSQMMLGQQCLMPGQLLLVQDPTNTSAQWAVMVADLGELPLEVADGLRLPHQPLAVGIPNRLPFKLVEASHSGRLEDSTPVLLLGTNEIGWVERGACRPASLPLLSQAMGAAWTRLSMHGGPGTLSHALENDMICIRGLKAAAEMLTAAAAATAAAGGMPGAVNGMSMPPASGKTPVQVAAMSHTSRKLLELEGALCHGSTATSATQYWTAWRQSVSEADSPATMSSAVLALAHQILPNCFSVPIDALWPELLALLGLSPPFAPVNPAAGGHPLLVSGREGEPSCLGVDMAVSLLQASIDWSTVRRLWVGGALGGLTTGMPAMPMGPNAMGAWPMMGSMMQSPPGQLGLPGMPGAPGPMGLMDPAAMAAGLPPPAGAAPAAPTVSAGNSRKPLPPVGPTAPPSAAPVGAGFSSRGAVAAAASSGAAPGGLPPRPPPVRVTTSSTPGAGSGPQTGGQPVSPTSAGQQVTPSGPSVNGLSPLRLVATGSGMAGLPALPAPGTDTKPTDAATVAAAAAPAVVNLAALPLARAANAAGAAAAAGTAGSPPGTGLDLSAAAQQTAGATTTLLVGTGTAGAAAGVPGSTGASMGSAGAATTPQALVGQGTGPGIVVFTQPGQPGQVQPSTGAASALTPLQLTPANIPAPLDLSAPPSHGSLNLQYGINPSPGVATLNLLQPSPGSAPGGSTPALQILNPNGTEQATLTLKATSLSSPGIASTTGVAGLGAQQPIVAVARESMGGSVTGPAGEGAAADARASTSGAAPAAAAPGAWVAPGDVSAAAAAAQAIKLQLQQPLLGMNLNTLHPAQLQALTAQMLQLANPALQLPQLPAQGSMPAVLQLGGAGSAPVGSGVGNGPSMSSDTAAPTR